MLERGLGSGQVVGTGQRVSEASLGILRGPGATGASEGVRGVQGEGLGAGRVRGPGGGGARWLGVVYQALSLRLGWCCVPGTCD